MNNSPEIHRLANSIAGLVTVITELINAKVKEANAARVAVDAVLPQQVSQPIVLEGWVSKKGVAEHFNISVRSIDNWMKRGMLPYIRTGKSVRFKLSEAEETLNHCFKIRGR